MATQREKAERLRQLHRRGEPLVLVNAWDAVSARILEQLGAPAIATTSAGIAWLEGFADGEHMRREGMLAAVARVTSAVSVPVTADLESGYGLTIQDAVATALGAIEAGAVGMNFEDWDSAAGSLMEIDEQVSRIAAIRKETDRAGVPLVVNARTDVFLKNLGPDENWRLQEATRRANRYLEAGANCAFIPGVTDERTIAALAEAIAGPINVLAAPSAPTVAQLAQVGVARISLGSSAMAYVLGKFRDLARTVAEEGSFALLAERIPYAEVNALFG